MRDGRAFPQTYVGWENILADTGQAYVEMVNTVVLTLLVLAVLLLLMVLTVAAVLRRRSSARMVLQEQANLRKQEEMNVRLEESNALLAHSKDAAEQALHRSRRWPIRPRAPF